MRPRTATLRDGSQVTLRPIAPDDKDDLREAFERLGPESRYQRFFGPMPSLSPAMLRYLTEVDHRDHEAIVAQDRATGAGLGVARYVRGSNTPPGEAETAITVVDDWQGRGLGGVLAHALADRAREEGVTIFTALVQADNVRAIGALSALGELERTDDENEVLLRVALPEHGAGASLEGALRGAAEGWLVVARTLAGRVHQLVHPDRDPAPVRTGRAIATVVVGTDGSPTAARAVATAVELAARLGAALHVVGAYGGLVPRAAPGLAQGAPAELAWLVRTGEHIAQTLEDAARGAREAGVQVTCHPCRGEPADVIISLAEQLDAELIVVGSRGLGSARRYLLGSVPGKVTHHAPCSVLVVRTDRG